MSGEETLELPGSSAVSVQALADMLRERLEASGQGRGAEISVSDLHRKLLPYRQCRDQLGFATKAEYDLTLLRLLDGQVVVRVPEEELAEAVRKELASPEPGLRFLGKFRTTPLDVCWDGPAANGPATSEESEKAEEAEEAEAEEAEAEAEEPAEAEAETDCWECGGTLAVGPDLPFCPHCGTDQTVWRCHACGEVLELEWKFCPRCGAHVAES